MTLLSLPSARAGVPPIPTPLRDYAAGKGLLPAQVEALWTSHFRGSVEKGLEAGGVAWRRYCDAAVDRQNAEADSPQAQRLTDAARLKALRDEKLREQAAAYEAWYRDHAVSFDDYLAGLMTRRDLQPHEELLNAAGTPPATDRTAWLCDVFGGELRRRIDRYRDEEGLPPVVLGRVALCRCGHPPKRMVRECRVYVAADCAGCIERRAEERRRAAG